MPNTFPIEPSGAKPWLVEYHEKVWIEDFPPIPNNWRLMIRAVIENRVMVAPELYGRPLRRPLVGLRKIRVGDYRIVFLIKAKKITVIIIGHRRDVYQRIFSRLTK